MVSVILYILRNKILNIFILNNNNNYSTSKSFHSTRTMFICISALQSILKHFAHFDVKFILYHIFFFPRIRVPHHTQTMCILFVKHRQCSVLVQLYNVLSHINRGRTHEQSSSLRRLPTPVTRHICDSDLVTVSPRDNGLVSCHTFVTLRDTPIVDDYCHYSQPLQIIEHHGDQHRLC